MRHYILTRFNLGLFTDNPHGVKDPDQWMTKRMELWKSCRRSVLSQKGQPFEWWILIDPNTPQKWRDQLTISPIIKLVEVTDINGLEFAPGPKITSRIDSDDEYRPGAIMMIQNWAKRCKLPAVVDIDYWIMNSDGTREDPNRPRANSMFASLVDTDPGRSVYCSPHSTLPDKFGACKIRQKFALHNRHGGNLFNKEGDNWNEETTTT